MNQIIYFISVVKNNNFTKAAEECHISQPAISQQIKDLENSLGVKLLDRKGRTFQVTVAGQYFYQHGQDLLTSYNELIAQTKEIAEKEQSNYVLRLGYLRDFGTNEFLQAVTEFSKKYPEVKVRIHSGNHEELFQLLRDDKIDLNFSDLRRAPSNKYVNEYLTKSNFEVVINKRVIGSRKKITSHELAEFPCILIVGNSEKDSELEYCRTVLGIESNFKLVGTYDEALVQTIAGEGYFLTNERIGKGITNNELKKLPLMNGKQQMIQQYYAFWKVDNSGFYIEEFADILKKQFR